MPPPERKRASRRPPGRIDAARKRASEHAHLYEYPDHLRAAMDDLPQCAGVYLFHGEREWPLYIGKSVNIRNRVLSHLRNADEARLLRQTRRISCIPTAGEVGALLLEAQMIKEQQPLTNQRLRYTRGLCALQVRDQQVTIVSTDEVNFAVEPDLYGLFRGHRAAETALKQLADEHRLCLGLLGLERLPAGRACFRATVNKCSGACCGQESADSHAARLLEALDRLAVSCWPYPGAVAIVEQDAHRTDYLVVRNWCYLGKAATLEDARKLDRVAAGFDADGYKILSRPIFSGRATIVPL